MNNLRRNYRYYFLLGLLVAVVLVWSVVLSETRQGLEVAFLDVGQGDAIFVETPSGRQVLIDGGQNKNILNKLSEVMPFYDRSIDVLVATHSDADHIAGLIDVLKNYQVAVVLENGLQTDSAIFEEFNNLVEEEEAKRISVRRGMKLNLDESTYLLFLFPDRDVNGWNSNDASLVAKLVYGETSFLLTGDSPQKVEKYLTQLDKEFLDVDVLKVGHHGSKTSSSELFLGYTSPQYAIISAGAENRYGHPHQEVLDLLEKFDIQALRTDEAGTINIFSDGESVFLR